MQLFYHPELETNALITFSDEESRHIAVLRYIVGDVLEVINGKGVLAQVEIVSITKRETIAKVQSIQQFIAPTVKFRLAISPLKNNDRIEWLVEKICEMGVQEIAFIQCERTERTHLKAERLYRIIQSACKQAKQFWFPTIIFDIPFVNEVKQDFRQKLIAYCEENEQTITTILKPDLDTIILIGPEGDFTQEEVDRAKLEGFLPMSLGLSRLRTETAGLYATAAFKFVNPQKV
jgi:16S rRNA (uracil1498-N3)-methyltransferase